ncbi:exonuclease SbcCD subunit D C-terminal domain-containing protein [Carboxylicivirga mesophila]|uniref:Nuclease SbcCD subunit D n=1 Tax=Carboxylicivirga mesophila TaxID=1166478 RepID=A0ABS5K651_9BACT|nr:exonuclease SbcCD subunit D C-terminal domain-containing protein [Carboxylicivirga mesophila]MBS2209853.1 exonuclease SbcCD subunit D C-terminal domain-containing protein [Carboxylicivirga mesophila]
MRILHTSDWHIGQKLHGNDREEEHQLFFDWLKQKINELQIDVLLVAGDVFDVGFPSNSALKLYYNFLTSLIHTHCSQVIITGGNHDYISTLEAPSEILSALNIQVIGGAKSSITDEVIELSVNGQTECVVAAVPFLRDKDIRQVNAGESYEDSVKATNQGIVKHYEQVAMEAKAYKCPIIAMGHLYVQGAGLSDSERDIHIGNLAGLQATSFPNVFDYVALGHIHRPQKLSVDGKIRYSGSPLPLSFSERKDNKQLVLLDVHKDQAIEITELRVPSFRKLIRVSGTFEEVKTALKNYRGESQLADWAEVVVEEEQMDTTIRQNFEKLIEETNQTDNNLMLIKPLLKFAGGNEMDDSVVTIALSDLSVQDVFSSLLDNKQVSNVDTLNQTFAELLDQFYHQTEKE